MLPFVGLMDLGPGVILSFMALHLPSVFVAIDIDYPSFAQAYNTFLEAAAGVHGDAVSTSAVSQPSNIVVPPTWSRLGNGSARSIAY